MRLLYGLKLLLLLSFLASSCHGRHDDFLNQSGQFAGKQLGISEKKSSIVVFGAGWCIPCIKEIKYVNKLEEAYGGDLYVKTYLVEGSVKGTQPSQNDMNDFNYKGIQKFDIDADPSWKKFKLFQEEKKLPLILLINEDGELEHAHNRSVKNEEELFALVGKYLQMQPAEAYLAETEEEEKKEPEVVQPEPELETPETELQAGDCSQDEIVEKDLPSAYKEWSVDQCDKLLKSIQSSYNAFFAGDDGEFLEQSDYTLEKAKVTGVAEGDKTGLELTWEKIEDGMLCTNVIAFYTDDTYDWLDSACTVIEE